MPHASEFLIGLLEHDGDSSSVAAPVVVTVEDFAGPAGPVLLACGRAGFLGGIPVAHPAPSCPHCGGGVPRRIVGRLLCGDCRAGVEEARLWGRPFDRDAFLGWLASRWGLRGEGVRRIDHGLWQLGAYGMKEGGWPVACFYHCGPRPPSAAALARVAAFRHAAVIGGRALPPGWSGDGSARRLALVDLLRWDEQSATLDVTPLDEALGGGPGVRFDVGSGCLWAGGEPLGEVPVGSREYFLLRSLAGSPDRFVPYADLKHEVCRRTGSADTSSDAAFCHALKRRIKQKWMPRIDELLATTKKGDGYRLRGRLPGSQAIGSATCRGTDPS